MSNDQTYMHDVDTATQVETDAAANTNKVIGPKIHSDFHLVLHAASSSGNVPTNAAFEFVRGVTLTKAGTYALNAYADALYSDSAGRAQYTIKLLKNGVTAVSVEGTDFYDQQHYTQPVEHQCVVSGIATNCAAGDTIEIWAKANITIGTPAVSTNLRRTNIQAIRINGGV